MHPDIRKIIMEKKGEDGFKEFAKKVRDFENPKVKTIPTHDPQTGELNPYYEELTGNKNPLLCEEYNSQEFKFKIGDKAIKPKGYKFPCTVVSVFKSVEGNVRVVGEMDEYGLLHIFNENQLEHRLIPPAEYHK